MSVHNELLQVLLKQEEELQFAQFDNETAHLVGTKIIEKAAREGKPVVVDIRHNGELLFYSRMNGKNAENDAWVFWKNNVVRHFGHSSYYMHVHLKAIGSTVEAEGLNPDDYKAEGGAFPLQVRGEGIVGTITVSGLPGDEDHGMVVSVLEEIIAK